MTEPQIPAIEKYPPTDNENAMDEEPTGDDEKTEYEYSEDYDDSTSEDNQQRFILAPTPAQLGRAPLQRRLGSLVGGDANSTHFFFFWKIISFFSHIAHNKHLISDQPQIVSNEATLPNTQPIIPTPTSMPSALPTPNSAAMDDSQLQNQLSPTMQKKTSFKKAKGEDLNKYVYLSNTHYHLIRFKLIKATFLFQRFTTSGFWKEIPNIASF